MILGFWEGGSMKLDMTPAGGYPADKLARESMIFVGVCVSHCPLMRKYKTKNFFQQGFWKNRAVYAVYLKKKENPTLRDLRVK